MQRSQLKMYTPKGARCFLKDNILLFRALLVVTYARVYTFVLLQPTDRLGTLYLVYTKFPRDLH